MGKVIFLNLLHTEIKNYIQFPGDLNFRNHQNQIIHIFFTSLKGHILNEFYLIP